MGSRSASTASSWSPQEPRASSPPRATTRGGASAGWPVACWVSGRCATPTRPGPSGCPSRCGAGCAMCARRTTAWRRPSALTDGDLDGLGPLLDASHVSLRDDFEVSHPEVERAGRLALAPASIMGGGFGGSVLALFGAGDEPPAGALAVEPRRRPPASPRPGHLIQHAPWTAGSPTRTSAPPSSRGRWRWSCSPSHGWSGWSTDG